MTKDPGQEWIRWAARFSMDERVNAIPVKARWNAYCYYISLTGESRVTRSDGILSLQVARAVGRTMELQPDKMLAELTRDEVGLVTWIDPSTIRVEAYEKWQDTAAEIEESTIKRSEAGRIAGKASGKARCKTPPKPPPPPTNGERPMNDSFPSRSLEVRTNDERIVERSGNENELEEELELLFINPPDPPRDRPGLKPLDPDYVELVELAVIAMGRLISEADKSRLARWLVEYPYLTMREMAACISEARKWLEDHGLSIRTVGAAEDRLREADGRNADALKAKPRSRRGGIRTASTGNLERPSDALKAKLGPRLKVVSA